MLFRRPAVSTRGTAARSGSAPALPPVGAEADLDLHDPANSGGRRILRGWTSTSASTVGRTSPMRSTDSCARRSSTAGFGPGGAPGDPRARPAARGLAQHGHVCVPAADRRGLPRRASVRARSSATTSRPAAGRTDARRRAPTARRSGRLAPGVDPPSRRESTSASVCPTPGSSRGTPGAGSSRASCAARGRPGRVRRSRRRSRTPRGASPGTLALARAVRARPMTCS